MEIWIVIPAYNEERSIGDVIDALRAEGWKDIIVVDDGSKDRTGEIAKQKNAVVVRHDRNRGLGAAFVQGFERP